MTNANLNSCPEKIGDSWKVHHGGIGAHPIPNRLIELETENFRLQRLVAELLIKNQQLRDLHCGDMDISEDASHLLDTGAKTGPI